MQFKINDDKTFNCIGCNIINSIYSDGLDGTFPCENKKCAFEYCFNREEKLIIIEYGYLIYQFQFDFTMDKNVVEIIDRSKHSFYYICLGSSYFDAFLLYLKNNKLKKFIGTVELLK